MRIYLLIIWLCSASMLWANGATDRYQNEPLTVGKLDKTQWQKSVEGLNYKPIPKPEPKNVNGNVVRTLPNINLPKMSFSEQWGRLLLISILVLGIGFVLFRVMVSLNNAPIAVRQQIQTVEDIEKNIHEADIDRFLREALTAQQYRLAVRLYYLAIIKELSLKGKIQWQRDKTNGAYLREMRNQSQLYSAFSHLTLIFEYVWYSNSGFNQENYAQVEPEFASFLKQI